MNRAGRLCGMDLTGVDGAGSAAGSTATDEVAGGTEEGRRMSALGAMTEAIPNVLKTAQILDLVTIGQRAQPGVPLLVVNPVPVRTRWPVSSTRPRRASPTPSSR